MAFLPQQDRSGVARLLSATLLHAKVLPTGDASGSYAVFKSMVDVHAALHALYAVQVDGAYANAFLNSLVLTVSRRLVALSVEAAAQSTLPIREAASPRSIKDATRQAIEKSMQVSACHMGEGEWAIEAHKSESVGDIMWPLANILWRLYAQVSESGLGRS